MSTALAVQNNGPQSTPARVQLGGAAAMQQTIDDLNTIRQFVANEMKEGLDFGTIPGTGSKPTLLQPGAQKIFMYFNCFPEHDVQTQELDGGHVEYIIKTRLISRGSQSQIGSGLGSCSTMESKYRWRNGNRSCPKCGSEAIIRGKAEYGGGWVCFKKKDGCGAKFRDDDPAITSQSAGRVENPDIHDQRNTVLKMAKKRSQVDAAHGLGCMSELFTQDLDDFHDVPTTSGPEPERDTRDGHREINEAFKAQRGETHPRREPKSPPRDEAADPMPEKRPASQSWASFVAGLVRTVNDAWHAEMVIEGVPEEKREDLVNQHQLTNRVCSRAVEAGLIAEAEVSKDGKPGVRDQHKALKAVSDLFARKPAGVKKTVEVYVAEKRGELRATLGMFDPDAPEGDTAPQDAAEDTSQDSPLDEALRP